MTSPRMHNTRGVRVNIPSSLKKLPRSLASTVDVSPKHPTENEHLIEVFGKVTATLSVTMKEILETSDDLLLIKSYSCDVIKNDEDGLVCLEGQWDVIENARKKLQKHLNAYMKEKKAKHTDADTSKSPIPGRKTKFADEESNSAVTPKRRRGRPRKKAVTQFNVVKEVLEMSEEPPEENRSECDKSAQIETQTQTSASSHTGESVTPSEDIVSKDLASERTTVLPDKSYDKSYECSECKETLKSRKDFNQHKKKHKTENLISTVMHQGETGDVLLKDSIALIDNFKMLGFKSYACKKCDMMLKTKGMALIHLKDMHPEVLDNNTRGQQEAVVSASENLESQNVEYNGNESSQMDSTEETSATSISAEINTLATDTQNESQAVSEPEQEKSENCGDHQVEPIAVEGNDTELSEENLIAEDLESESQTVGNESQPETDQESSSWSLEDVGRKICNPTRSLMITKPEKATVKCEHCGFKSTLAGISSHVRRYHSSVLYTCDICEKSFGIAGELNAHRKNHFDSEGNKKPLNWRVGYQYKKPDEDAKFPCEKCDKGFYRKVDLKHHMSVHQSSENTEGTTYQCGLCKFQSIDLPKVKRHIDKHHSNNSPEWKCDKCSRLFTTEFRLFQHKEKTHSTDFICDLCNKQFAHRKYLYMHKKRHAAVKKYVCDVCGKGFHENNKLLLHKEVHLSENERTKRFICDVCQRSFASNSYLKDHMNIHRGLFPYICGTCGKKFPTQVACRRHAVDHNKELKFKCPVSECGKMFSAQFRLKYHMTVHTKQSKYTCTFCHKAYTQLSTLKRHVCKARGVNRVTATLESLHNTTSDVLVPTASTKQETVTNDDVQLEKTVYCCSICQKVFDSWDDIQLHVFEHADPSETLVQDVLTVSDTIEGDPAVNSVPDMQTLTSSPIVNVQDITIENIPENVVMETIVLTEDGNQSAAQVATVLNENETQVTVLSETEANVPTLLPHTQTRDAEMLTEETEQYYDFDESEKCTEALTINEETIVTMETKIIDQD